ncbi:Sec63 [Monascus purpureus]|uniref:DNA 3'-5' helicase n=1 Tax=Monascus purpureus TaxID=5098 RepID=A0A507R4A5_MONPU|nr:Sec63 [Monascus purpureus]
MGTEGQQFVFDHQPKIPNRLAKPPPDHSPFFGQRHGHDDGDRSTESEFLTQADDELQLDAFDLELLAQSDGGWRSYPTVSDADGVTTSNQLQESYNERPSQQDSSFFSSKAETTPLRGLESSGSELGTPSSPLTRLQLRKVIPLTRQDDQGSREARQGRPSRNPYEGLSSHTSRELSSSTHHTGETPFMNIPISVRGIKLVSVNELPVHFRSMFGFPLFNAIQSKCFRPVYKGNDNVVLAAPTGSGKTVVMELAICRLLNSLKDERFKVVYQAPTKSLCAERYRDWNAKFSSLDLKCAELTGDTDHSQLKSVQTAQIIITTPEKWDSVTRKWKDHSRLMQLVKLFLIDEVHILKETRGATLEAVVSRMKSFGSNIRFIALSATVPNSEDIATWLGKDATNQQMPAHREHFGEDFRPVRLQKFVYGYHSSGNDFAFDKMCSSKLPDIIGMHSCNKPIMIFCSTRNSAVTTAKELSRLWSVTNPPARLWKGSSKCLNLQNLELKTISITGVAFHHAGLDPADRHAIEAGFLGGQISVICCTSTLAVGVNLPCHLVIIKNTVGWQEGGCREYSDLEMMQMLGRAGRPQFDDSATAVILTRKERVGHYQRLVSGSQNVESCLHLNLVDHLNVEIGLGTVRDVESAVKWLAGTFLFVRLRRNPTHYKIKEGANQEDEDEILRQICKKDIKLLQDTGLVSVEGALRSTEFGDAMARYYVRFETMKTLLSLSRRSTISQILNVIAQAEEFREIRLKPGEKSLYKEINKANCIRFPIKVDIALPAHKISLLIQSELGGFEFGDGEQFQKHKFSFQQDKNFIFNHISRLIRCVIDCQICLRDSITARNALELARSFGGRVWDNSPLQMKQMDQIGVVAVRKLAAAGVTSIEALELTEAYRIDMILSKNPPFGMKLLARLGEFPKLRVSIKMMGKDIKPGHSVKIRFKAEVAFMNEKIPTYFQRRPVYVCFLAETANKLHDTQEILLIAELTSANQHINCYAMCDEIAGTLRSAELKPNIPTLSFLPPLPDGTVSAASTNRTQTNISHPRNNGLTRRKTIDAFDGDDLFDDFVSAAKETGTIVIEDEPTDLPQEPAHSKDLVRDNKEKGGLQSMDNEEDSIRLPNGRWACNHKCKDKATCKHFCCREGLEKPPKASKKPSIGGNQQRNKASHLTLPVITKNVLPSSNCPRPLQEVEQNNVRQPSGADLSVFKDALDGYLPDYQLDGFSRRKKSSSYYEDDILYDLPSSSQLLYERKDDIDEMISNKENQDMPGIGNIIKENKILKTPNVDTEWLDIDEWLDLDALLGESETETPVNVTCTEPAKPALTNIQHESPETWTPLSKPRADLDQKSTGATNNLNQPSSITPITGYSYLHTPCTQKRKPCHQANENGHENSPNVKRLKQTESSHNPLTQEEIIIDNGPTLTSTSAYHSTNDGAIFEDPVFQTPPGTDTGAVPSKDWEDIDPALLDEFKDIVNFF